MSSEACGLTLGAAIVATFAWPKVVFIGGPIAFVLAVIGCVIWERVWTKRNDLARDRQARDDKAVRTWMDSEGAA